MHFDDRLATVLNLPVRSEALAWIQYRQLIDILGRWPGGSPASASPAVDAAYARLEALGRRLPSSRRAAVLEEPGLSIANPELLARLVLDKPEVAAAAIRAGDLDETQWLELIPALPVRARGILRHRRDLPPRVVALLERLGITDRGLPAGEAIVAMPEPEPLELVEPLDSSIEAEPAAEPEEIELTPQPIPAELRRENVVAFGPRPVGRPTLEPGIGDIVRRIEEFRASRHSKPAPVPQSDHPLLPLDDMQAAASPIACFDFTTDAHGRIDWADPGLAAMVVGAEIAPAEVSAGGMQTGSVHELFRRRQPLRNHSLVLEGAAEIAGDWRIDASPRFDGSSGHFSGYLGRARRALPAVSDAGDAAGRDSEHDRMRQVLHELRTPANAIQFAAGFIQQEMGGAIAHDYRALAAAILGDIAQILAGFDELDRLVRLETGAISLGDGPCDMVTVVRSGIARLAAWSQSKGSGFELSGRGTLLAAIEGGDAEQLVRRILAAMAWHSGTGEILPISCEESEGRVTITVGLPSALADPEAWDAALAAGGPPLNESPLTGRFGFGFTLRLAQAEAAGAGGTLERDDNTLKLSLPGLTALDHGHSHAEYPKSSQSA
ncbi:ATP-binding protein [Novosphingobium aquimarinum]|uniref:sensor histidine kinase n=1 Tax=Novosphingobium aquimarinum TaxID=2682494 RepID=UPI0012EBF26D|nr:sensor histidine kinase [Novosphingobium aquimarinum]